MVIRKWKVRVWNMTASYSYAEYASDKDAAIDIVRGKVMPDMKNWNFSASLAEDDGDNDNNN
jgi:hypothetical protein